jgi:hypothetical protein
MDFKLTPRPAALSKGRVAARSFTRRCCLLTNKYACSRVETGFSGNKDTLFRSPIICLAETEIQEKSECKLLGGGKVVGEGKPLAPFICLGLSN